MAQASDPTRSRIGVIHIHSDYSRDGRDSLEELREFARGRGIGFIGLTDHAEDFVPELFDEYVEHCRSLSDDVVELIPGLEFRFPGLKGLHLLALRLTAWGEPATPADFFSTIAPAAGMTILAHPVLFAYRAPEIVLERIDAVEVWNANYNTRYLPDPRAIDLLDRARRRRPEVVGTAGLDQHDRRNDRRTRVLVDPAAADPIAELRAGRFTNVGMTMRFDPYVTMTPWRRRALTAARWGFDKVERTQERFARALHEARRAKPRVEVRG